MNNTPGNTQLSGEMLVEDVLHEALVDNAPDERPVEPEVPQPPPPPPQRDYYEAAIAERRKRLKELQDKVMNHETNRAYVKVGQNGSEYIDIMEMNADQARISALTMEIQQLKEESDRRRHNAQQRREAATQRARAYARQELAKLPEDMRRGVAEKFAELFSAMTQAGGWDKAHYASPVNIDNDVAALFKMALGEVAASRLAAPQGGNPAPSGLEGGTEPQREEPQEEELDPFTNNLMYAYERRKKRSMTFAEAKRAQMEGQQ